VKREVAFETYGVTVVVELGDATLAEAVSKVLPPGHTAADPAAATLGFELGAAAGGLFVAQRGERRVDGLALDDAVDLFDGWLREAIAAASPELVFVHAGVVAHRGRGLVLPGATFTGKTELVLALLGAGATYCSDEFAVIDREGRVHPYPRPLGVRDRDTGLPRRVPPAALGAATAAGPVRPAVVAMTRYVPGASWQPRVETPAAGVMHLLAHSGQARSDPERVLAAVHQVADRAVTLAGPRGEADEAAAALLRFLEQAE
jgi:hypothetical protein